MNPRLQAAKNQAVHDYLKPNSNIVGVGIGTKQVNGRAEECVRIYVIQRQEDETLIPKAQLVSKGKNILEDVPADVIAFGPFGRRGHRALLDTGTKTQPGSPIRVNTDISNVNAGARGTLGVLVTNGTASFILGCNHILAVNGRVPPNPNAATIVSGEIVGDEIPIGSRDEFVEISASRANVVDCALARLNGTANVSPSFPENTVKLTSGQVAKAQLGRTVSKVGAGTFFTKGKIVDEEVDLFIPYSFVDVARFDRQFMIESTQFDQEGRQLPFATSGDSGALVVDEESGQAVGMIFASSGKFAVACPIETVLTELSYRVGAPLSLVIAANPASQTSPTSKYTE